MHAGTHFRFLDWPGPIPFAHRGGASEAPENTMPAFEHAVRLGYRYLETDVHVTADGVVVAFHDHRLDRVTDGSGVIAELPWSKVKAARVGGAEPIPLLEDLLGSFPEARVNIDPKHDAVVEPLAAVLQRCNAVGRVLVAAFSDRRITRMRQLCGPDLCTAMGPREISRLMAVSRRLPGPRRLVSPCVQVPPRQGRLPIVTRRFVETAHRLALPVHVWTIDDADEMARLLDLGVDGIMTDRPQVLRQVLEQRNQWFE